MAKRKTQPPTTRELISGNLSFERILRHTLGDEDPPMKAGKRGQILAISKQDKGLAVLQKHTKPPVRDLIEARLAIRSWPTHVKRLNTMSAQATACGGKLPVQLKYCGAHTARWSGAGGWNAQNFGARAHPLISEVRGLIKPPPGHQFVISDFAGIEARVCAWLVDERWLLDAFIAGRDVYLDMATQVIGRTIPAARANDPPPVKKYLKHCRTIGKIPFLGGIYGVGGPRLQAIAENVYGLVLPLTEATRIVDSFRASCPALSDRSTGFWQAIQDKIIYTTTHGEETQTHGLRITLDTRADRLDVRLPSGRRIRYYHPRVDDREYYPKFYTVTPARCLDNGKPAARKKINMWGGFFCENIVQAIARDLLAEAILHTEAAGYRVALHVHDEIVAVVPDADAEAAKTTIEQIMSIPPTWAEGLPLAAEAQIAEEYGK